MLAEVASELADVPSDPRQVLESLLISGRLPFDEVQSSGFSIEERQARNDLFVIRSARRTLAVKTFGTPGACTREATTLRHLSQQSRLFDVPRCTRISDRTLVGETAPSLVQLGAEARRRPGISTRSARQIAEAVASLHGIPLAPGLEHASEVISPDGVGPLILDSPAPVRKLIALFQEPQMLDAIGRLNAELADGGAVLVHGDLRPANILLEGAARIWLIDWETAGLGSRWRDLGALLAALIELAVSEGRGPPDPEVVVALLRGYAQATERPPDHSLVIRSAGLRLLQATIERTNYETSPSDQGRALLTLGQLFLLRPVEGARHLGITA